MVVIMKFSKTTEAIAEQLARYCLKCPTKFDSPQHPVSN